MEYSLFDAHCDTLLKVFFDGKSLYDGDCDVSIKKLSNYKSATQLFAVFNEGNLKTSDILKISDLVKSNRNINFVTNTKNLKKVNAMLSIEGLGNTKDLKPEDIKTFYDAGFRVISLTWNQNNPLCGGIEENNDGLSPLGKDILSKMEKENIVLDVSHISDKGFFDCFENFSGKIVATHSNSRKICNHMRNLTDEEFLLLKKRGGVAGLNLYPLFLNKSDNASVKDMICHIEHFLSLGGENNIGIGADFDGTETKSGDIYDASKMNILFNELAKLNYSDDIISKISHKNFENMLQNV